MKKAEVKNPNRIRPNFIPKEIELVRLQNKECFPTFQMFGGSLRHILEISSQYGGSNFFKHMTAYPNEPISGIKLGEVRENFVRIWIEKYECWYQISIYNLNYILQHCGCAKNGILPGEYVFAWDNSTFVLLPTNTPEYEYGKHLWTLYEKKKLMNPKSVKPGHAYLTRSNDVLIYLGEFGSGNLRYHFMEWDAFYQYLEDKVGDEKPVKLANLWSGFVIEYNEMPEAEEFKRFMERYRRSLYVNPLDNTHVKKVAFYEDSLQKLLQHAQQNNPHGEFSVFSDIFHHAFIVPIHNSSDQYEIIKMPIGMIQEPHSMNEREYEHARVCDPNGNFTFSLKRCIEILCPYYYEEYSVAGNVARYMVAPHTHMSIWTFEHIVFD